MEFPEDNFPFFIYPFDKCGAQVGRSLADGFDVQIYGHIMDVINDRHKATVVGEDHDQVLIEIPLVPHQEHKCQATMKASKKKHQC